MTRWAPGWVSLAVIATCAAACLATPSVQPTGTLAASTVPTEGSNSAPSPSSSAGPTLSCGPDPHVTAGVLANPCPGAIAAVLAAVASNGLAPMRVVIRPDNFPCGALWPSLDSPPICFDVFQVPGRSMHAWVSFDGSRKVAAVLLQRDVPLGGTEPPSAPPWRAYVKAFAVPPSTFVMP